MKIIRSRRKTISLSINRKGEPVLRAPLYCSKAVIDRFLAEHQGWLEQKLAAFTPEKTYSEQELKGMKEAARAYFLPLTERWAERMGVAPTGVKITAAKTRYGSCSPKGSLCFSLYLMEKEERAREYVVVHELAHLLRRDHSKEFYRIVETYLPDYKERIKELKKQ